MDRATSAGVPGGGAQDRARDGVEHLQTAVRELIHAARAMLDVAEELVEDPETVASLLGALGTVGEAVRRQAGAAAAAASAAAGAAGTADGADSSPRDGTDHGDVQRITVL